MKRITNLEWCNALTWALATDRITDGAALTGFRLATLMDWNSDFNSGELKNKNSIVAETLGMSDRTLRRNTSVLKDAGFMVIMPGFKGYENLVASIPAEISIIKRDFDAQRDAAKERGGVEDSPEDNNVVNLRAVGS